MSSCCTRESVLAQGQPAEISASAAGRTFLAEPPAGQPARELQAQLLEDPDVRRCRARRGPRAAGACGPIGAGSRRREYRSGRCHDAAVAPRFEDGFMVVLRQAVQP